MYINYITMIVNAYQKAESLKDIPENYDEWRASITQDNAPRVKGRAGCLKRLPSYTDASPNKTTRDRDSSIATWLGSLNPKP